MKLLNRQLNQIGACLFVFAAISASAVSTWGANFQTTLTFPNQGAIGQMTQGRDGNFYGVMGKGGNYNAGAVVQVTASGSMTTIYSFTGGNDGNGPVEIVTGSDGNLYGATAEGGDSGFGTVFQVTTSGSLTTLYSFSNDGDGYSPNSLIQGSDGNLYGTTLQGGDNEGVSSYGTVFQITTSGSLTTLNSFDPSDGSYPNGYNPNTLVQGSDGNLYGTTLNGGSNGDGTVFQITTTGSLTSLYSFSNDGDGYSPSTLIQGNDGYLYGTTREDYYGWWYGTVFQITITGELTTLYSFTGGSDGYDPAGLVQGSDQNLYGTTLEGSNNGYGSVYQLTTSGSLTTLYSFGAGDGYAVGNLIAGNDGDFYGSTNVTSGGLGGEIYKIATSGSLNVLNNYPEYPYGNSPGGMVGASDGNFYGTMEGGGDYGRGAIVRVTTSGSVTALYSFTGASDGENPGAALIQGSDGNFYGTTQYGGNGYGTIFKVTTSGSLTTLYAFADNGDGYYPQASLTQGPDGKLYGTTEYGGTGWGSVFKITTSGSFATVYAFSPNRIDGYYPHGSVVFDGYGNLYGTTEYGGYSYSNYNSGYGTVYKITPAGSLVTLHSFNNYDGEGPMAGLIRGMDGNLYGTTSNGAGSNWGTVFRMTTSGSLTTLYTFPGGSDGREPQSQLLQAIDGNLYGTTPQGGGNGTVFQVTMSGSLTTIHGFGNGTDGSQPLTGLVTGSDGNLYGTTSGYSANAGWYEPTVFQISSYIPANAAPVIEDDHVVLASGSSTVINVLANAEDPNGNALKISSVSGPTIGNAVISKGGTSITYTPDLNFLSFAGSETFTYTVTNSVGTSSTAEITVWNPFYLQKGNFAGTLGNAGGGYLTLATTGNGAFTGKVRIGPASYSLTGNFNASGFYTGTVNKQAFTLQMDLTQGARNAFGSYSIMGSYAGVPFVSYHALYNSSTNPAPEAGSYTVLINPPAQMPVTQATASVTGIISGVITGHSISVVNSGTGYISVPQVTITSNSTGSGATATAIVSNGQVTGITVTKGGSHYPATGVTAMIAPPSGYPQGIGYATLSVTEAGAVTITGKLSDGTAFTDGVTITGGDTPFINQCPVYMSLGYKAAGSLVGAMTFEDIPGVSDCDGTLSWNKPAQAAGALYQGAFNVSLQAIGSRYAAPLAGNLALLLPAGTSNAVVGLNEQDWSGPITKTVTVAVGSSAAMDTVGVVTSGSDALQMSLNAKAGTFSGSFMDPSVMKSTGFAGVLFPKQSMAGGYFLTPTMSGAVSLTPP